MLKSLLSRFHLPYAALVDVNKREQLNLYYPVFLLKVCNSNLELTASLQKGCRKADNKLS